MEFSDASQRSPIKRRNSHVSQVGHGCSGSKKGRGHLGVNIHRLNHNFTIDHFRSRLRIHGRPRPQAVLEQCPQCGEARTSTLCHTPPIPTIHQHSGASSITVYGNISMLEPYARPKHHAQEPPDDKYFCSYVRITQLTFIS